MEREIDMRYTMQLAEVATPLPDVCKQGAGTIDLGRGHQLQTFSHCPFSLARRRALRRC